MDLRFDRKHKLIKDESRSNLTHGDMHKGRQERKEQESLQQMHLLFGPNFLDHHQRRESLMQFQGQEPEAFPIIDTSHILHNPSMHCIPQKKNIQLPTRCMK
jgi:hypothetical protein